MIVPRRSPEPVDFEVGRRIRTRRMAVGMSQTELAEHVGVTFQQIQKYEKGLNRVASSRLHRIAHVLGTSTAVLMPNDAPADANDGDGPDYGLFQKADAIRLVRHFNNLPAPVRQKIVELVESIEPSMRRSGRRMA